MCQVNFYSHYYLASNGKDIRFIDTRWKLKPFQIPYIENKEIFKNKITIESTTTNRNVVEY